MPEVVYLTTDVGSAHQIKRAEWMLNNDISVTIKGFGAERNQQGESNSDQYIVVKTRSLPIRIAVACYCLIKSWTELSKKKIIVRGLEFEFLCMFFRLTYIVEYSDINPRQKKGTFFFWLQNKIFSHAKAVFFTSPAFADYFCLSSGYAIWHNSRRSGSFNVSCSSFAARKPTAVYCGYIRNFHQIGAISEELPIDVHGVFNILGFSKEEFSRLTKGRVGFGGSFLYDQVFDIYSRYRFAYVGDNLHFNSRYNLTNRLYESLEGGALPFTVGSETFLARFMSDYRIGAVLDSYADLRSLISLSSDQWCAMVRDSHSRITELVRLDDEKVLELITL